MTTIWAGPSPPLWTKSKRIATFFSWNLPLHPIPSITAPTASSSWNSVSTENTLCVMVFFVLKVENKAWKPGVARPSKSKARWVNTTNKMQVRVCAPTISFNISFDRWSCIVLNSGLNCSRSEHTEVASEQQRCSQVLQKLLIIQAQPSDFQIRAQKKQKTGHKSEICGPAKFKFMYKGLGGQYKGINGVVSFLFSLDQGRLVEGEVWSEISLEIGSQRRWRLQQTIWGTRVREKKDCEWGKRFCNSFGEHCIFCWFLIAKTRTEYID